MLFGFETVDRVGVAYFANLYQAREKNLSHRPPFPRTMRRTPPRSTALAIRLAKLLLAKYRSHYRARYQKSLPILLVAGTAGKSSVTLLLKNLFERDGWTVYSGARPAQCLNSITGLTMVLGGFESDFEGRMALLHKLWFLLRGYLSLYTRALNLPEKTILVYEVGFNEQHESEYFQAVFEREVNGVILTNLTYEHSFGFGEEFDTEAYREYKKAIPHYWRKALEDSTLDGRLRNIALEQFKLLSLTSKFIAPLVIGSIDNGVLTNFGREKGSKQYYPQVTRAEDFVLEAENLRIGEGYLLPQTFAKNAYILETVATYFAISKGVVASTLEHLEVPNGRFSLLTGISGSQIVDSTYNSDPASLNGFLTLFEEVVGRFIVQARTNTLPSPYAMAPKHTLILGEMRELGSMSASEHAAILTRLVKLSTIYANYIEDIFLVGHEWLALDDKVKKRDGVVQYLRHEGQMFKVFKRAGDINELLDPETLPAGSWYWIKGSQNTIFLELVVEHLLANKDERSRLCRRGSAWDEQRKKYH